MLKKVKNLFIIYYVGVRICLSEIALSILKWLKKIELTQLQKRLNLEYTLLGKEISELNTLNNPIITLHLEQIKFLKKEIEFLKKEHEAHISHLLTARKTKISYFIDSNSK